MSTTTTDDTAANKKRKAVRFGQNTVRNISSNNSKNNSSWRADNNDDDDDNDERLVEGKLYVGSGRPKKRPRPERPNEDEMDDVDDWVPEEDEEEDQGGDGDIIPSKKELLKLKRQRRNKRSNDDDNDGDNNNDGDDDQIFETTNIDESTSLASEGIQIEPFHMNKEKSDGTGYFDGDTYVFRRRADGSEVEPGGEAPGPGEEPDAWLDNINDKTQIYKEEEEEENTTKQQSSSNANTMDTWTKEQLYCTILPLLATDDGTETVMQALIRYGNLLKRKPLSQSKIHHDHDDENANEKSNSSNNNNSNNKGVAKTALDDITSASNALLLKGDVDIYQKTRNQIKQLLSTSSAAESNDNDHQMQQNSSNNVIVNNNQQKQPTTTTTTTTTLWEYSGSQDGQIHGPYTTQQMKQWIQAGYFIGSSAVYVRTVVEKKKEEEEEKKKSIADDLLSDLMDDDDDDDGENKDKKPEEEEKQDDDKEKEFERGEWISSNNVDFTIYQ